MSMMVIFKRNVEKAIGSGEPDNKQSYVVRASSAIWLIG